MGQKIYESDKFLKTGGTSSQYLMADGSTSTGPSGGVDVGTGTANKIPKFSDSDTITDGIMTDDGTSVLVNGNLAIGTADNDNLLNIEATDNNYDVSRALHIDYTKSHSTTGWGASAFGARVNVYADGTGQNADLQGGSFGATHIGSGITYYLLGSQSNAKHEGSGNTGAIWGAFNQGRITGTGTGTHPFLIGTNQKAELNNVNASVGSMSGILAAVKTNAGDVTGRMDAGWFQIDGNQGTTTVVDANVLYLQADVGNITASGTMRTIHSVSTLPSLFAGTIEAPKFYIGSTEVNYLEEDGNGVTNLFGDAGIMIETSDGAQIDISDVVVVNTQLEAQSFVKTGGTSSQFLKADGSVDSNTYAVGTIPTDFVSAASGGTFNGALTIDSDTDTILKLNNSDNGAQYVTYSRSNDRHAYVGFGGSSDNFTIMSEETGGQIILGTAATTRMTIASDGHVGINEASPQEELHVTGRAIISERLAVGGNFTPQKALHMKNTAPVFRMEDSDTAGYAEFLKSSSNFTFRVDPTGVESASELRFQVDGNELMTIREDGVGFGDITPTEMVDVNGNVKADSFIKDGGTSSQFLKADGSVDSSTYSTTDTQLTTEEVQDIIGFMVQGNTEQSISVTYSDGDGKLNFDAGAATYTHPGETAFTAAVDTGALTGAVVVSDIDMNITTNAFGHVEDAAMAVATRTLTLADLGFTGDLDATNDQVLPTDFVSAASGGSFGGGIVADSFTITGLSSGDSFLKANGSLDGTTYNSGVGASGGVAIYDGTNTTTDDSNLQYNFLSSTLTSRNLDVSVDLNVGGDVDVTGNIVCDTIQADGWTYIPQTFQSNFVHSTGNGYMNLPFNSTNDNASGGEQHFMVTPYGGYVHSVAFKNTATGTAMTGTNMNFRVLVNGVTSHTSGSQTFTAAARTYKGWVLTSTNATFNAGDDLRFQFRCTSGVWQDTCAVVVLKCII